MRRKLAALAFLAALLGAFAFGLAYRPALPRIGPLRGAVVDARELAHGFVQHCKGIPVIAGGPVDQFYFAPSVGEVARLMKLFSDDLAYRGEVYDCDDFSRHFKDRLLHQWAAEGNLLPLPIVEVYASIMLPGGKMVGHAFNAIITDEGRVVFIEPQDGHVLQFKKAKIVTIYIAVF